MKKILSSPPTPTQKRQRKITNTAVNPPSGNESGKELKFMEATFRVVGYQVLSEDDEEAEDIQYLSTVDKHSVFQPDTRKKLSKGKLHLVEFIKENYAVPSDFETNTKFGPHSGLCFEDRLITSYEWKQLKPADKFRKKSTTENEWKMCWKCEEKGNHLAREGCPKET